MSPSSFEDAEQRMHRLQNDTCEAGHSRELGTKVVLDFGIPVPMLRVVMIITI
jgi:hypothetical protein